MSEKSVVEGLRGGGDCAEANGLVSDYAMGYRAALFYVEEAVRREVKRRWRLHKKVAERLEHESNCQCHGCMLVEGRLYELRDFGERLVGEVEE